MRRNLILKNSVTRHLIFFESVDVFLVLDFIQHLLCMFKNSKSVAGTDDVIGPTSNKITSLPSVPPEVMRTASERHQKGLMSPYIYQILTQVGILYFASIKPVEI
jgi:hypothetical protein